MIVFKTYFKIIKSYFSSIMLYMLIFLGFSIFISQMGSSTGNFVEVKPNIAIIDNANNELSKAFISYASSKANLVEIVDEDITDALFFRKIDYVATIPEDFDLDSVIETRTVPESYRSTYTGLLFNRYFNVLKAYVDNGIELSEAIELSESEFESDVEVKTVNEEVDDFYLINGFYNFSNYTVIAILVFVIGLVMMVFNSDAVKKRNVVSSMKTININSQLFLANLCLVVIVWLVISLLALGIFGSAMLSQKGLLLLLNSFIFILTIMTFAQLMGNLIKNKEAQNGVVNVVGLGSSFISGAFVPQMMLSGSVLMIAKIFPSYYFINNNDLVSGSDFELSLYLINIIIMVVFAIGFFISANYISRNRRSS